MHFLFRSKIVFFCLLAIVLACFAVHAQASQGSQGYVTIDEGELYYSEIGQGLPIIVVHGGPGLDQGYLQPQLLQLSKDYKLIFYDQRGSGKSIKTKLDEKHINIDQFVSDLEALRKSLGLDQIVLMGHSWGGLLAMQYAVTHQDHLLGLILLNTAPADYKGQKAFMDEFVKRTKPIDNNIKPLFSYEEFKKLNAAQISDLYRKLFSVYFYDPNKVKDLSLHFTETSAQSGFRVMEEMKKTSWLQPNFNLFPQLKTLAVPTFIIHGEQDLTPAWTAKEIKEAIPDSEIIILNLSGHFPYIEQPSAFFKEIHRFLNKITHNSHCVAGKETR